MGAAVAVLDPVVETVCKTFCYRSKWTEHEGSNQRDDGYLYAVNKEALLDEIARVKKTGNHLEYRSASDIKVVPIGMELYEKLQKSPNKCWTTVVDKHPLDFEVVKKH